MDGTFIQKISVETWDIALISNTNMIVSVIYIILIYIIRILSYRSKIPGLAWNPTYSWKVFLMIMETNARWYPNQMLILKWHRFSVNCFLRLKVASEMKILIFVVMHLSPYKVLRYLMEDVVRLQNGPTWQVRVPWHRYESINRPRAETGIFRDN